MSRNSEDELVKFILRPENFDTALEISERFPQVIRRLQSKFWITLEQRLEKLMAKSPKEFKGWECDLSDEDHQSNYFSFSLAPRTTLPGKLHCFPALQQDTAASKFQLSYGICWSEEITNEPRMAEYDALKRKVRGDLKLTGGNASWWIGRASLPHSLQETETLKQLARDDSIERLQADQLVSLFQDTKELLESLNRVLLKK
jgi:hypothetical protein